MIKINFTTKKLYKYIIVILPVYLQLGECMSKSSVSYTSPVKIASQQLVLHNISLGNISRFLDFILRILYKVNFCNYRCEKTQYGNNVHV